MASEASLQPHWSTLEYSIANDEHGMYGIEIARRNKRAEVVAIDWECVLVVAKENALKAGIDNRYSTIDTFKCVEWHHLR